MPFCSHKDVIYMTSSISSISSIRDRTIYIGRSGVSDIETASQEPVG